MISHLLKYIILTVTAFSVLHTQASDFDFNLSQVIRNDTASLNSKNIWKPKVQSFTIDSITLIVNRIKNGDQEAFKPLAECYRYGYGVEKCLFNAAICYHLSGDDINLIARNSYKNNPDDELGIFFKLMETLDRYGIGETNKTIEEINLPNERWVSCLLNTLKLDHEPNAQDIKNHLLSEDATGDEFLVFFSILIINDKNTITLSSHSDILPYMAQKVPIFYNILGDMELNEYEKAPNKTQPEKLINALRYFKQAHSKGFISPRHARKVLALGETHIKILNSIFTSEELQQLNMIGNSNRII